MSKMKKGKYIIGQGKDFRVKGSPPKNGIGYDHELAYNRWYIVDCTTAKIVGDYETSHHAIQCARFLHDADQLKLSNEIEKILSE